MLSKSEAAHPSGRRPTMPEPDGDTRNVSHLSQELTISRKGGVRCPVGSTDGPLRRLIMEKWIITGGAGFIGCHAAARLHAAGHRVVLVVNLSRRGSGRAGTRACASPVKDAGSNRRKNALGEVLAASRPDSGNARGETGAEQWAQHTGACRGKPG